MKRHKYTLCGVIAIVLWSTVSALMRIVTESLGPVGGAALIYSLATMMVMMVTGLPRRCDLSLRYVVIGGALFAGYEACMALSLGLADSRHQAVEMMIINYLWPVLTVLFAAQLSTKRVSLWLYPSVGIAFIGVVWSILGGQTFSLTALANNIATNPLSYSLALIGAVLWATYCVVTKQIGSGKSAVGLFFLFTAAGLWLQYALSEQPPMSITLPSIAWLVFTGIVMAAGYGLWNQALLGGNMMLLATLSYFTPIMAALFSALLLGISLSSGFWQGVGLVTLGSLLCWWMTRTPEEDKANALIEREA